MAYDHTNNGNTDMNRTQPTPGNCRTELVVKITSPLILSAGIVGNILIICVLVRTKARNQSFANYFTALAVTDLLQLFLSLFPRCVEAFVRARFDVDGHLMCRLGTFLYLFLFTSSSLLLAAMTVQRAAGVVLPHRVKAVCSTVSSYIAICSTFAVATLLTFHVLVKGRLNYTDCYFGSMRVATHKQHRQGHLMAWIHFLSVFMLPFLVILVSNCLLISGVNASKRAARKAMVDVSQPVSSSTSSRESYSLTGQYRRRLVLFVRSMSSITAVLVATSLFFCFSMMPAFLLQVLIVGQFIDEDSISPLAQAVLDELVFFNSSCKFYLYCISGRSFRQELGKICKWLLCGRLAVSYNIQATTMASTFEVSSHLTTFTGSFYPSPIPTPSTSMTNSKWEPSTTVRQRQQSPQADRFENRSVSPNGQAEPTRHSESGSTPPHQCKTSSEPTRSPNTAADTHTQTGETVPSELHPENLLESGTALPHPSKTSPEPVPSTGPPSTAADTPIQTGKTVPSKRQESLPLSGLDMEAEGDGTEPGTTMALFSVF